MNIKPTLYWNPKIVMSYLIQAAAIHRRLPDVRTPGYHTLWPVMLRDEWERLYDMINGTCTMGSPMPPEVTFHENVMEWLRLLDRSRQQLVWMRSNKVPWKILTEEFGRSKATLSRQLDGSLCKIVSHLNRIDSHGDLFRDLRNRANSFR